MSKIRIALPLWKRKLHEDGFRLSPTPADVIPPPDNEHKEHWELPFQRKLDNPRYDFNGWLQSPLPDDNDLAFKLQEDLVHPGIDRHSHVGWTQQPLSDDNDLSFKFFEFDLPELGTLPLRFSYEGWTRDPLSDDSFEASTLVIDFVPAGLDRHFHVGFTQSPLAEDVVVVEEALGAQEFPSAVNARPSQDGHIDFQPPENVEDPAIQPQFPDQVNPRLLGDGFTFSPLPGDVQDPLVMPAYVDQHFAKFHPDHFQAQPLLADNDVAPLPVAPAYFDLPIKVSDYQLSPLSADNDNPPAPVLPEFPFERNVYFGFQTSPTVEELNIQPTMPWPQYPDLMFPRYDARDISLYLGAQASPLSVDLVELTGGVWRPTFRPRRR